MSPIEMHAHTLLAPHSRGVDLSPAMRLVALQLLLWAEAWEAVSMGRRGMDIDYISECTSLKPEIVAVTLEKLLNVGLIEQTMDGWILSIETYKRDVLKPHHGR